MRHLLPLSLLFLAGSVSVFAAVDSGLLALVPSGAKLITSVDIEHARSSQFGQYMLNRIDTEDPHFEQLIRETGFDPRRDLQDFIFASPGAQAENGETGFVILARGMFDPDRIKSAAKARGAVIKTYQGVDMILDKSNNQKTGVAFPEVGVAIMADSATLRQIIANRDNSGSLDPDLRNMVFNVGAHNDAWFVSLLGGSYLTHHLNEETKQPLQQAQALESILESSGGIRFGDVVQLSFDAKTRSPKDATSLADVIRFLGSLLQMQRQSDAKLDILASALDQMNLTTAGDSVHLSISMPEKSLEQLADMRATTDNRVHHQAQ